MSNKSLRMELAVSVPPAPFPIIVCVPECSEVKAIAFSVPLTQSGSSFDISFGPTTSSASPLQKRKSPRVKPIAST